MSKTVSKLNPQIREEAVEWLLCFSEGDVERRSREAFVAWLRTSPEHVRAYLRVSALWGDAGMIDRDRKRTLDELVEQANASDNVIVLSTADRVPHEKSSRFFTRRLASIAATVIVAVAIFFVAVQRSNEPTYITAIGEQRSITLLDGSRIELNALSALKVKFSENERRIELTQGQALFSVAKDPARPFIVNSGGTLVKAVGTQFDVNRKPDRTVVTVLEGRVAVTERESSRHKSGEGPSLEPVFLDAGQQVVVQPAVIVVPKPADMHVAIAWTEGLLVFDSTPLSEVAQEFNRHNPRRLVIDDESLAVLEISGVFPASSETRIVEFLRDRFDVEVQESSAEIRIARR